MGFSYLEFKDKTLKMNDMDIFCVLYFVLKSIETKKVVDELVSDNWLSEVKRYWIGIPKYSGPGLIDLNFNRFFDTDVKRRFILNVMASVKDDLKRREKIVDGKQLAKGIADMGAQGLEFSDRSSEQIIQHIDRLVELLS